MDIFEAILDILNEKIYNIAFNKNNKLSICTIYF